MRLRARERRYGHRRFRWPSWRDRHLTAAHVAKAFGVPLEMLGPRGANISRLQWEQMRDGARELVLSRWQRIWLEGAYAGRVGSRLGVAAGRAAGAASRAAYQGQLFIADLGSAAQEAVWQPLGHTLDGFTFAADELEDEPDVLGDVVAAAAMVEGRTYTITMPASWAARFMSGRQVLAELGYERDAPASDHLAHVHASFDRGPIDPEFWDRCAAASEAVGDDSVAAAELAAWQDSRGLRAPAGEGEDWWEQSGDAHRVSFRDPVLDSIDAALDAYEASQPVSWSGLFGVDPDYTEGEDVAEFIERNRGQA